MKIKNKLQYIATPGKVFMTALIILLLLSILQGISIGIENMFILAKRRPIQTKSDKELTQEEERIERISKSRKEFLPDGTIHLIHRVEHISHQKYREQIYDVNDNLLWEDLNKNKPYEYLPWAERLQSYREVFTQQRMKQIQMITPGFSQYIEIPVGSEDNTGQLWRYNPGAEYFIGYDDGGEKIGYLGSNGFTDSKSEVESFGKFRQFTAWCPVDSENPILLWQTQRHIYQIDFEKRHVEPVFESADSDINRISLHAWRSLSPDSEEYVDREKYRPLMHCETRDRKHHLILREPKQQFSFELRRPSFVATRQEILVLNRDSNTPPTPDLTSPQHYFDSWVKEIREKTWNYWNELYKVDSQGNLELLNRYDWIRPPLHGDVSRNKDSKPIVHRSVSQFSPLMYDLFMHYIGRKCWTQSYSNEYRNDFFYGLIQAISEVSPHSGIINRILSVLMMSFVFWHGWPRRTSWTKFIFWLVFTGLFNIAGLLTYLALNHTAVIKCPVCGKRRGLAQVECVQCQAQLPAPEQGKLDLIFSN